LLTPSGSVNASWCTSGLPTINYIAFDAQNYGYILPPNGNIAKISPNGAIFNLNWATGLTTGGNNWNGLAFDSLGSGVLYVANRVNTIYKISPTGQVTTWITSGIASPWLEKKKQKKRKKKINYYYFILSA
jgi:hypothetical protein